MEKTVLVDDIDEKTTKDVQRIKFGLDGVEYEIDLRPGHAKALREAYAPYVGGGRKKKSNGKKEPVQKQKRNGEAATIRAWAIEKGYDVKPGAGRIPNEIKEAYANRNQGLGA